MDSVWLIVCFMLLVGQNLQIEAGILDPVENIFVTGQDGNTANKVIDPFLSPMRGSDDGGPEYEETGNGITKAWWEVDTPTQATIDNTVENQTPDYDKIVANRFPGAVSLLEKLKELNKLKEQQQNKNTGTDDKNTTQPGNSNEFTGSDDNNVGEKTTEKSTKDGATKHLTKRRFYFQVQPVRPEGEDDNKKETVYYVDK